MKRLGGRLFVAVGAAVLVAVIVSLAVGALLVHGALLRNAETTLDRQAQVISDRAVLGIATPPRKALKNTAAGVRISRITLAEAQRELPGPAAAAVAAGGGAKGTANFDGRSQIYAARPLGDGTVVVVTRPERLLGSDYSPFLTAFLIAAAAGAVLAALVAFVLARGIARPVRRVADASSALAEGLSPAPLPAENIEELNALAHSFNEMAAQLRDARAAERTFLLSVSHELKTPLTSIRGYAEALQDGTLALEEAGPVIEREAGRLERLVADLLALARLQEPAFAVAHGAIDLAEVGAEAVRRAERQASELRVGLTLDAPSPAPAVGDFDRALQVVSNLVENALRVSPAGATVMVRARPGELEVSDAGPGIAPEDLPRAFERFYLHGRGGVRADGEPSLGSGLGLAIVEQLARAMGGSAEVTSTLGKGSTFTLRLPGSVAEASPADAAPAPAPAG